MKHIFLIPLITLSYFFNYCLSPPLPDTDVNSALSTPHHSDPFTLEEELENVIGYNYNIWALKADRLSGTGDYEFTGRIFLDKRKTFRSSYDKKEHAYLYKEMLSDGEIFYFNKKNKASKFMRSSHIGDYYMAFKCAREWTHHKLEDIVKNKNNRVGEEVNCTTCNYEKRIFDVDKDWLITVFYEISPIYKKGYIASLED